MKVIKSPNRVKRQLIAPTGAALVGVAPGENLAARLLGLGAADAANALAIAAEVAARELDLARFSPRVKPAGYSYVPGLISQCPAPGGALHDLDVEQTFYTLYSALQGTQDYFVDPANGLDTNPGTRSAPFTTLKKAYQAAGCRTIYLMPGTYTERWDVRSSDNLVGGGTQARAIVIDALEGFGSVTFRAAGDQPSALSWVSHGVGSPNVYKATPSGAQTANLILVRNSTTNAEMVIPYKTTIANVDASGFGWYQDPGTKEIYIRIAMANIDTIKATLEIMYSRGTTQIMFGSRTLVKNIIWRGDNGLFISYNTTFRPEVFFKGCAAQYLDSYGWHSEGGLVMLQNCTAYRTQNGDGGNYYDQVFAGGGQSSEVLEVDCTMVGSGQPGSRLFDGSRNKQGSSGHSASVIARVNGEYRDNYGQNIADTGAASKTWMVGTVLGNPFGELFAGGTLGGYPNLWTEGAAYIDSVLSGGPLATYGLNVQTGAAKTYNCTFSGTTAAIMAQPGASIAAYDPRSP